MYNRILFLDSKTVLTTFLGESLKAEGYQVVRAGSPNQLPHALQEVDPHLIIVNMTGNKSYQLLHIKELVDEIPIIALVEQEDSSLTLELPYQLEVPFAFQDLLLLVQDILYQRTVIGETPLQVTDSFIDALDELLNQLRKELRARCIVLSSSSGRLIKTVGSVDQSISVSLAALMSAGFSATARAAQMLGYGEMFDSSLQESEGYGLYAIRLYDRLILSVAFSDKVTVGLVRHRTAQAAIDILEMMAEETQADDASAEYQLSENFRETVNDALGDIFRE